MSPELEQAIDTFLNDHSVVVGFTKIDYSCARPPQPDGEYYRLFFFSLTIGRRNGDIVNAGDSFILASTSEEQPKAAEVVKAIVEDQQELDAKYPNWKVWNQATGADRAVYANQVAAYTRLRMVLGSDGWKQLSTLIPPTPEPAPAP